MEYKKIENEIDNLLHNGGLNPYEKKLLRKVKRKFCANREREKVCIENNNKFVEVWLYSMVLRKTIRRLIICNLLSGVAVILTIAAYFLK